MFDKFIRLNKYVGATFLTSLFVSPVLAHEVKLSGDVAVIFHIEPHHNPKAGVPSQVWFAMTKKGGQIIPLSDCNCKLEIHADPHVEGSKPLLEPPLKPVSAEQYHGIPGAIIVFPKVGEYELELSGSPKKGANFKPFEASYTVIVGSR